MYRFHLQYYKNPSHNGFVDYITLDYGFWAYLLDAIIDEECIKRFSEKYDVPLELLQIFYNHSGYDGEGATESGEYYLIQNAPFFHSKDVLCVVKLLIENVFNTERVVEIIDVKTGLKIDNVSRCFFIEDDIFTVPTSAGLYWDEIKENFKSKINVRTVIRNDGKAVKGEPMEVLLTDETTIYQKNKNYFNEILLICEDCLSKDYWFQGGYHS